MYMKYLNITTLIDNSAINYKSTLYNLMLIRRLRTQQAMRIINHRKQQLDSCWIKHPPHNESYVLFTWSNLVPQHLAQVYTTFCLLSKNNWHEFGNSQINFESIWSVTAEQYAESLRTMRYNTAFFSRRTIIHRSTEESILDFMPEKVPVLGSFTKQIAPSFVTWILMWSWLKWLI